MDALQYLRFLHIPKTAGSTFTSILKRQYAGKGEFIFTGDINADIKKFEALPERESNEIVLFTGHAPITTGITRADLATTITFLRDPISRVKSFCQHVSEGKSSYLIDDFNPASFDLDSFLESGNEELSNLQTKMLINHESCISSALLDSMPASEAKNVATHNLFNKISHFGLQEYFDESLIVFGKALNWKMPLYAKKNRKKGHLLKFEDRHLIRISELNAIDIEVYNIAKERFINILNSATFDKARLKWFRLINKPGSYLIRSEDCIKTLIRRKSW